MAIKGAFEGAESFAPEEVEANFPTNNDALKIFTFGDYVTALQAERTCTAPTTLPPAWTSGFLRKLDEEGPQLCQDFLATSPACQFGGFCDCATFVDGEEGSACGTMFETDWGDIPVNDYCPLYCGVCEEGEEFTPPDMGGAPPMGGDGGDGGLPPGMPSWLMGNSLMISGIYNAWNPAGSNWQVPFVKCDSRFCEEEGEDASGLCEYLALGVAPSTANDTVGLQQAERFRDYIYERYPVLLDDTKVKFDFEFVQMMESNAEVEKYVTAEGYGGDTPKLALAVIFDGSDPTINYNYAIRHNSTGFNSPEDEGRPATVTGAPTNKLFEALARTDSESCPEIVGGTPPLGPYGSSCTGKYAYNGFLTIQRLVHDFIIADSGAADAGYAVSEGGVSFAPFPSKAYIVSGKEIETIVFMRITAYRFFSAHIKLSISY